MSNKQPQAPRDASGRPHVETVTTRPTVDVDSLVRQATRETPTVINPPGKR